MALGRRLGISHSGVRKLEQAEATDAITLASLRKLAQALDCELHYAFIPKRPLNKVIDDRALEVARERMRQVAHHMALEAQGVEGEAMEAQVREVADSLARRPRQLW